ncbi:hypothetical protein [Halobacteriovorax sp. HLS]|uniref:hypothetical protein n=1 Tax=Halobacteriovorax sp. HLS TaxID=2234000 RepID=UPI000FD9B7A4|nr:hypothetical protein [Halobacteriovorax sp. HLS]
MNKNNSFFLQINKLKDKEFNEFCDQYFNFLPSKIEAQLRPSIDQSSTYAGEKLEDSALSTSWYDYYKMILLLEDNRKTMVDLGSAYSKGSILCHALGLQSISSIEVIEQRVAYSKGILKELSLENSLIHHENALTMDLSQYDIYFIYQPVSNFLTSLLDKICLNTKKVIWAIESHGDLISRLELDTRLENESKLMDLNSPRHLPYLFQFHICHSNSNQLVDMERRLFEAKYITIETDLYRFGKIRWCVKVKNIDIDYLNNVQNIIINEKRFSGLDLQNKIIEINPTLSEQQIYYLDQEYLTFEGKEQKILKHILYPKNYVELLSSGLVKT